MRLIIVSNRLPFTLARRDGRVRFRPSAGGLASGMSDCLGAILGERLVDECLWVGWPGAAVDEATAPAVIEAAQARGAHPVFLSGADEELFYSGFSNRTLWPLCHYFPTLAHFETTEWEAYHRVNEIFARSAAAAARPGDIVWVHDYQLMLVPGILRRLLPNHRIGYFHHIPFPAYEIFRLLPAAWGGAIIEGLLGADLIGFHTHDYAQNFLKGAWRVCGLSHRLGSIDRPTHRAVVDVFPMGIDPEKFRRAVESPATETERRRFDDLFRQQKVVVSIDRLDYTKGIINRLNAFAAFLERYPEWRQRVSLALVVVPSRTGVADYRSMKRAIDQVVGDINGRFSAVGWTPVFYRYRSLSPAELAALYSRSDVALVTPLRDGMNLIAKEYAASHPEGRGVLILSAFAGAADELGEALIVNPFNHDEMIGALKRALEMPADEQGARLGAMNAHLEAHSVHRWGSTFIGALTAPARPPAAAGLADISRAIAPAYAAARRRLIFLDYDGTLAPFHTRPEAARPDRELLILLSRLSADARNHVVIVSGRDRWTLTEWFGELPLGLIAEHGAWVKTAAGEWEHAAWMHNGWKEKLRPLFERYGATVPGSFIEEKPTALVWHYRGAAGGYGEERARNLVDFLLTFTAHVRLRVLPAQKAVEVQVGGVDKGLAAGRFLSMGGFDFTLALGDDFTDEDIFAALPAESFSVHVGASPTTARFTVRDYSEARLLLGDCTAPTLDGEVYSAQNSSDLRGEIAGA